MPAAFTAAAASAHCSGVLVNARMHVFQTDMFNAQAVGHGQGLFERKLPETERRHAQLVLMDGVRCRGRRFGRIGVFRQAMAGSHRSRGPAPAHCKKFRRVGMSFS